MQILNKKILTSLCIIGIVGNFTFLWAMYEFAEIPTYCSMFMLIMSLLLTTISFALLEEMCKNETK
jgi:hypothetical protein